MSISESLLMAVLGMGVVFLALFSLYLIINIMTAIVRRVQSRKANPADAPAAAVSAAAAPAPAADLGVTLIGTTPKEAACIMAIVSDESGIPLNQLRFISIKAI